MSRGILLSSTIALSLLLASCPVWAQEGVPTGYDLQSVVPTVSASVGGTIIKGEEEHQISPGQLLTPAEHLALIQAVGGNQTLQLAPGGNAIGGIAVIHSIPGTSLSSLVVPSGVTVVHDVGLSASVDITGNLSNSGTVFAISTNSQTTSATFNAINIANNSGALFTTSFDPSMLHGLGLTNLVSNLSLNLVAQNSIVNAGTISSSANLSVIAGDSIVNAATVTNTTAQMASIANLNLSASNIINSGLLSSQNGNVNLNALSVQNQGTISSILSNLSITNALRPDAGLSIISSTESVISSLRGHMHLGLSDQTTKSAVNIHGGTFLAQTMSVSGGDGNLDLSVRNIESIVSVHAGTASFEVTEGKNGLTISSFEITGDPNLIYTGSGPFITNGFTSFGGVVRIDTSADTVSGSITFTGPINTSPIGSGNGGLVSLNAGTDVITDTITTTAFGAGTHGGDLSILALGNITTGQLNTSGPGRAGNITLASGGNTTVGGVSSNGPITSGSTSTLSSTAFGVAQLGQVSYSGSIFLQALGSLNVTGIDTSGTAGGSVFMTSLTDSVIVADNGITTSGATSLGGNVDITSPMSVLISGGIRTSSGGGAKSGDIALMAPSISAQNSPGGGPSGDFNTRYTGTSGAGGNVYLFADNDINILHVDATAGSTSGSGGNLVLAAGLSGSGNITTGNLTTNSNSASHAAGVIAVTTPGIITAGDLTARNTNGNAGQISVIAGTAGGGIAPAQSGVLTLGNIDMTRRLIGGQLEIVNMGTNGNVVTGNINLSASGDPSGRGADIAIIAHGTVTTGNVSSSGPSSGEDLFISSGATTGTGISTGAINLAGGMFGGNIWFIRRPGATVSTGTITQTGGSANGALFNGTPAGAVANLTNSTVLTISPGTASGFYPGGFDSINIPAGTLTLNQPASRILAPIVARGGNVNLNSVVLTSAPQGVFNLVASGNISINNQVTSLGRIFQIVSTAGTVAIPTFILGPSAAPGALGVYGAQGITATNGGTFNTSGTVVGGPIAFLAPGGQINFGLPGNAAGSINASAVGAGGRIDIVAGDSINVYNTPISSSGALGGTITLKSMNTITLTNMYGGVGPFNTNINVAQGGTISIDGVNGLSGVRDTTLGSGGTSTAAINNTAGSILVRSANGSIDLSDYAAIQNTNGNVFLTSACCLNAPRTISANTIALQSTQGANITLNGIVNAANDLFLTVSGSGAIVQSAGTIAGSNITLSAENGSIGNGVPIQIADVSNLTIATNGDAMINDLDQLSFTGVNILQSFAGTNLALTSAGPVNIVGPVSADTFSVNTNNNGNINIQENVTAATTVSLIASGIGNINALPTASITAPNVILASSNGDIGTVASPIRILAGTVNATTNPPGQIFITRLTPPNPPSVPSQNNQASSISTSTLTGSIVFSDLSQSSVNNTTIIATDVTRTPSWDETEAEQEEENTAIARNLNRDITSRGITATLFDGANFDGEQLSILQNHGIVCGASGGQVLQLESGTLLAAPTSSIIIRTEFGAVNVAAGSLALIIKTRDAIAIYDLHDNNQGDVTFTASGKSAQLFPGFQLTVGNANADFDHINPAKGIGIRGLITESLSPEYKVFASDFSLASAISKVDLLRSQYTSGRNRTINAIAKNAAIQQHINSAMGAFQQK